MKNSFLTSLFIFLFHVAFSQDYITRWDLSQTGAVPTSLTFGVGTAGIVNYTWETIPAGMNGAGTFTGNTATISGLPAGSVIRLRISPANFNRMNIDYGSDKSRLMDIEQWGSVEWLSMATAYHGCNNLNVTATDVPNLSLVSSMDKMFRNCSVLNGPTNINSWNTSNVQDMSELFNSASVFNQAIGNWNTANVTDMNMMLAYTYQFNQPIGNWNTAAVTDMSGMLAGATSFNQPIGNWNTSNVITMHSMFAYAALFNQPIGNWNISSLQKMNFMFQSATSFNQPIGNWNTSNVTDMGHTFVGATVFNQPLSNWNTALVTDMQLMFNDADAFNQPLENWDVSNVHYMPYMFKSADSFNQPLGNWNTSNVSDMRQMFLNASSLNQSLGNWDIGNLSMISEMLNFCGMDCGNYSSTIAGWSANPNVPQGLALGASTMQYGSNVQNQRNYLTLTKGWSISGDMATNTICCFPDYHPITDIACQFYTYNGQTYVQSGVYHDTLLNALGCDSIIVLNLNILHPDVTVSQAGPVLTANAAGVAYQWIRCPS
ncbi:MAG: DUF285 domain-containing protein, partial [Chitinophagaceae bacterium]|nr:DUF285 domain-containing protein [Chitinophagaceae bacterium]